MESTTPDSPNAEYVANLDALTNSDDRNTAYRAQAELEDIEGGRWHGPRTDDPPPSWWHPSEVGSRYAEEQVEFAWNLFEYNTTLAAKLAVGHGVEREKVAMSLHSLADAIANPTSVAEDMRPIDDANTLLHLML
jgi:hypothetical protein